QYSSTFLGSNVLELESAEFYERKFWWKKSKLLRKSCITKLKNNIKFQYEKWAQNNPAIAEYLDLVLSPRLVPSSSPNLKPICPNRYKTGTFCILTGHQSALTSDGFKDWKKPTIIQTHENSENHRNALLKYLTTAKGKTLTSKLEEEIRKEQQYWRYVIVRVFAVIRTLAEQGLQFRGENEKFETPNNGNCFGLLELAAKFDPFLRDHIDRYGNTGSGKLHICLKLSIPSSKFKYTKNYYN
ncbi:zinc finger MYM-type protein 1, partial [Caerostris darwini]